MILVIDTSGNPAAIATLDGPAQSELFIPARDPALRPNLRRIAQENRVTKVAVATGPGSFTGLRVGVSFGLGLAMGLQVPIVPLNSLELLAARSDDPVIAVRDAGRGRFYFLAPGSKPALGEASDIPRDHRIVDTFQQENGLRGFAESAAKLLEVAEEVPYRNLEIQYMQSFARKG